ncbi:putative uridylyltransferase [Rosistilla carotiformis]|uniref:Putative uridylyltransferase n=1 Tax=Rosistilla carotiformis TaxID=2528017 RepID=A0A518JZT7_9BACT|nr:UTP--glucose-1-phosphate uridylyltransferase [Rosistilla carotiformis]QDV71059.1 putative uridylyltransferase [Rosistilla carotiformis]
MNTSLQSKLASYGQQHLLQFWDQLNADQQQQLVDQIDKIDFSRLQRLVDSDDAEVDFESIASRAEPPRAVRADGSGAAWSLDQAIEAGSQALADGKVGMILVAGGQGSRLGFEKPKGLFPIGPVSQRTLFQMHADLLKAICERYQVMIPLYVMTSPATHDETIEYFAATDNLGLRDDQLQVFCQGTMPAVDRSTGRVLLESKHELALSPDGHGGTVSALASSGCLQDAISRGIEHLAYAQVDNPLANPCDAALIGHHILADSDMTTQVVRKRDPLERVGNVVLVDGKVQIIEYIHLPDAAARQTEADGSLRLWAGNIAIHVFKTSFLKQATDHDDRLPFNRAYKKVPFVDGSGNAIAPADPNAIKFERFIFDLLPMAKNAFVVEGIAEEIFAPVKNADGAPSDTPAASRQAISDLHRKWLQQAGANVEANAIVEIHPLWAQDAMEVGDRVEPGLSVSEDRYFEPEPGDLDLVIVTRCDTAMEASIIEAQLAGEGIQSFSQGTHASLALSGIGNPSKGIPVRVANRDAERARAILQASENA